MKNMKKRDIHAAFPDGAAAAEIDVTCVADCPWAARFSKLALASMVPLLNTSSGMVVAAFAICTFKGSPYST